MPNRRIPDIDDLEFEPDLIDDPDMFDETHLAVIGPEERMQAPNNRGTEKTEEMFPRKGPWSGNPELGQSQRFAPNADNLQTILKMAPWGMPKTWCISLGMEFTPIPTMNFQVVAELLIGSGGSIQRFEVDWHNGTRLSVCGDTIEVQARYDMALPDDEVGTNLIVPPDLILSAQLGEWTGQAFPQPTRTIPLYDIGTLNPIQPGSVSDFIRIPAMANTMQLIPTNAATESILWSGAPISEIDESDTTRVPGDVNVLQLKRASVISPVGFYNNSSYGVFATSGWPITNGARFIQVHNDSIDTELSFFVKFGIQL